jgi:hypothetical protein
MSVSLLIKNGLHRLRHIRWLCIKEDTNKIRFLEKSLMRFLKILRLVDYLDVNHQLKKFCNYQITAHIITAEARIA